MKHRQWRAAQCCVTGGIAEGDIAVLCTGGIAVLQGHCSMECCTVQRLLQTTVQGSEFCEEVSIAVSCVQ